MFTGTGFDLADFIADAQFGSIKADSVTIDSATQATAVFNLGVPIANEPPVLPFTKDSVIHYAPATTDLLKELVVSSSTSDLECSFAGGCSYEVTAAGLSSIL